MTNLPHNKQLQMIDEELLFWGKYLDGLLWEEQTPPAAAMPNDTVRFLLADFNLQRDYESVIHRVKVLHRTRVQLEEQLLV